VVKSGRHVELSAVLVVPNIGVGMEVQNSIPFMSIHDLLQESSTFKFFLKIQFRY
jgi:hypothetical protein